jgi:hypothetical protein
MPAVLNEAFNSPFHQFNQFKNNREQEHDNRSSSGTESLHNPLFGFQVNPSIPMMQDQPMQQASQAHIVQPVQQQQKQQHDCDRLIAMIMACPHCRQKVRELMSKSQNGGAMTLPSVDISKLSTATIGNFIFGIAVLFLVDRIIKLKLKL